MIILCNLKMDHFGDLGVDGGGDDIEMYHKAIVCEGRDWIHFSQDRI
jgi:hypothetical protein